MAGNRKRRKKNGWAFFIFMLLLSGALVFLLTRLNDKIMPIVLEIAERRIITQMSEIINQSYNEVMGEIQTADLYQTYYNEEKGSIESVDINTLLINNICNQLAVSVSGGLNALGAKAVEVPLGVVAGIDVFATMGPTYEIKIQPIGSATVSPKYNKSSLGINQISLQLWLTVTCDARIATPLYPAKEITITRDVQLVDKLITGDTPNTYWGTQGSTATSNQ